MAARLPARCAFAGGGDTSSVAAIAAVKVVIEIQIPGRIASS
jgi:hypothetical protein